MFHFYTPLMRIIVLLLAIFSSFPGSAEPLKVFTTIPPLQTLLTRIGGDSLVVNSLVADGFDPHIFEPTPRQIGKLAEADLYVSIGMPFEAAWQSRIKKANPRMRFLDASEHISNAPQSHESQHHNHAHDHHGEDPHIWTNPVLLARLVPTLMETLANMDANRAVTYQKNGRQVIAELQQLDKTIHDLLLPVQGQSFLVLHPAWGHFAKRYQLKQLSLEFEGKRNSARHQAELLAEAKASGLTTVFAQNQSESRSAAPLAETLGGSVVIINPLAANYSDNLLAVARSILDSLQQ